MSLDLPLTDDLKSYGTLHIKKDLRLDPISHYTLRRIEHLRRSVVRKLKAFDEAGRVEDERLEAGDSLLRAKKAARNTGSE